MTKKSSASISPSPMGLNAPDIAEARSEQELVRREKLQKLRTTGFCYPNDVRVTADCSKVRAVCDEQEQLDPGQRARFAIAGRMMTVRLMGKAAFCNLEDRTGVVQCYVKQDHVGAETFEMFKGCDLGDIFEATGYAFKTKTGEPSLHVEKIRLLVKCLHPLPEKWRGLTDVELRYRQRYVDLIASSEVRELFVKRAQIIATVRRFLDARGYVEVETPVMSGVASGAAARPFQTHHNTLDLDLHLRIALELPLKRLIVGGLERVYELGRVFRNEGISTQHNPEFTMIEFYQAYATYTDLMELTEQLVVELCDTVVGSRIVPFGGVDIDYSPPWQRLTIVEALYEIGKVPRSIDLDSLAGVKQAAKFLGSEQPSDSADYGLALYELFDRHVENQIVNPTFITRFPTAVSPLSRLADDDRRFVDRFEVIVAGMELANAFSELNDPEDQAARFAAQLAAREKGDEEAMAGDPDFIRALEYGMPPTAGEGIGIDRLVMLLTGAQSIRDVLLFPLMRPPRAGVAGSDMPVSSAG